MLNTLRLIRTKQWVKNFMCFAGIIFSGEMNDLNHWISAFYVFLSFCFTSSSIYVLNDILDKDADSFHPKKKHRPIPSGSISINAAIIIGLFNFFIGVVISWMLSPSTFVIILIYLINNILYTTYFKKIPLIDVFSISFGFILRVISGIYIINDLPTPWIMLCTMFLALFLGFSKRLAEKASLNKIKGYMQREVLSKYTKENLVSLVNETSFGAVLSYALFTTISGKNSIMIITIPIVYYGITYYKLSLFNGVMGEEPEQILLTDKKIQLCIALWLTLMITIIYLNPILFYY